MLKGGVYNDLKDLVTRVEKESYLVGFWKDVKKAFFESALVPFNRNDVLKKFEGIKTVEVASYRRSGISAQIFDK